MEKKAKSRAIPIILGALVLGSTTLFLMMKLRKSSDRAGTSDDPPAANREQKTTNSTPTGPGNSFPANDVNTEGGESLSPFIQPTPYKGPGKTSSSNDSPNTLNSGKANGIETQGKKKESLGALIRPLGQRPGDRLADNNDSQKASSTNQKQKKEPLTWEEVKARYAKNNQAQNNGLSEELIQEHSESQKTSTSNHETHGTTSNAGVIFEEYGEEYWNPRKKNVLSKDQNLPGQDDAALSSNEFDTIDQNQPKPDDRNFWVPLLADRSMASEMTRQERELYEANGQRNFTQQQLERFTGEDNSPILIAIDGDVFDVSRSRRFFGPGGQYSMLAGRDISVCLAKLRLEEGLLGADPATAALTKKERRDLRSWHKVYGGYKEFPLAGRLVAPPPARAFAKAELTSYTGRQPAPAGYARAPILVGVAGRVYDVSFGGWQFYGEGAPYHLFAGRDASRALAQLSFAAADLGSPELGDLGEKERGVLADWERTFARKKRYPVVGWYDQAEPPPPVAAAAAAGGSGEGEWEGKPLPAALGLVPEAVVVGKGGMPLEEVASPPLSSFS